MRRYQQRGRNGDMIIVGVVDEIKLRLNFLMILCMKYDIMHSIEWKGVYFASYIEVDLHEIEFILHVFLF